MNTVQIDKNIVLESSGRRFLCDAYFKNDLEQMPLVVFAHGYKGYKDWGAWSLMAKELANAGYYVVTFNFSHNGTTVEQPTDFADLEAFGHNTFVKELNDLDVVLSHFVNQSKVQEDRVAVIGHSRGGGITVLKTYEDPRIKALVTLAGVSDFAARMPKGEALKKYLAEGVMFTENKRTGQKLPHYWSYYDSFIEHKERLNIQHAAENLSVPYLIIAAEEDEAVKLPEAENLNRWCKTSQLVVIPKTGHTFGAKEPWDGEVLPEDLKKAVDAILKFLNESI